MFYSTSMDHVALSRQMFLQGRIILCTRGEGQGGRAGCRHSRGVDGMNAGGLRGQAILLQEYH